MFLVRQKYVCSEQKLFFINGKPKMTKKIEFEKLKISQNGQISGFGIFNFSNSNFVVIFGFPLKTIFRLIASIENFQKIRFLNFSQL